MAEGGGEAAALDAAVRHYASLLFIQRLRTPEDRRHAAAAFADAWGEDAAAWQRQQRPELHISPAALRIGWARLPRATSAPPVSDGGGSGASELALLPSQLPVLESLGECAARGWMCLLVGPPGAGKTAAVRTLAALCGQPLLELSLTSGTDTSDLLGGFEQVEPARKVAELAREARALLAAAAELLLPALQPRHEAHQRLLRLLGQAWQACSDAAAIDAAAAGAGAAAGAEAQHAQQVAALHALQAVLAQLLQLLAGLQRELGPEGGGCHTAQQAEQAAARAAARAAELAAGLAGGAESAAGKFEWVDGALTR
jgi:midasin